MLIGTLIAGLTGGLVALVRYTVWRDNLPSAVLHLRWVLAFAITFVAIIIEVAVLGKVDKIILMLNGVLFLSIGQILGNSNPIKSRQNLSKLNCPKCNAAIVISDKFCQNCGTDLTSLNHSKKCQKCGFESAKGSKFCSNCGAKILDENKKISINVCPSCNHQLIGNEKFCGECGSKIV